MRRLRIKRGDLRPVLRTTLTDDDGNPVDLTGATEVRVFVRRSGSDVVVVDEACTVLDAAAGDVEYAWQASDTDTSGKFEAEFEVQWPQGPETFPNDDEEPYTYITITEDIK